jgi:serine/threonine protein phosphatase 1
MRTLAIGDVHGCNTALVTLLRQIRPVPADRIVFLGDYIDRGPASRDGAVLTWFGKQSERSAGL